MRKTRVAFSQSPVRMFFAGILKMYWMILLKNSIDRTAKPMLRLQDWSTALIAESACGLYPNPTAGLTV